jgi:hypothetical protein
MNREEKEITNIYKRYLNALAIHFLKFLRQPAFGTFAKPHILTQNQSFAKEPNFAHTLNSVITFKENNYER